MSIKMSAVRALGLITRLYKSVSCFVLAFASAETNLPYITLILHEFPGLENEILKFYDYPGFSRPDWVEKSGRHDYQKNAHHGLCP